ncbi:hypothetical protein F3Y22_tig00003041pilonHSYRG01071 [Hibiscus syriacus]|uniref:RING-type domain-containing protein n=1 Tax=Hibiscus syriacus TaxID=106335 RepID=A0A6A3CSK5_HIBSY|nr:probable E3 ubiquitin-protein ligase XERICO [Hibiscus syriacus]KAE8730189.1 hypothetical protein F3Y22_tig00003041pilonHSYRG01071 [Hibiscus syriacus]
MGLSNFPSASEGILPMLVLNTVLSVALLKNMVRSLLQVMGATWSSNFSASNLDIDDSDEFQDDTRNARKRRVSITRFKSLCHHRHYHSSAASGGCCVCLCGFQADEEVSELSCKHFFHKGCLDKWFNNKHSTCPLCRAAN